MTPNKAADLKRISSWADETIALSSDLKPAAIDEKLRDLSSFVKDLLRKKRCEIGIVVVSDPLK
jgi:hypothetical protein